jgi:hypothetical protein
MTESSSTAGPVSRRLFLSQSVLPWLCTGALLLGIGADRLLLRRPAADATAYHQRVRQAAEGLPLVCGGWLGTDVPVPQGAVTLLKPNVIVSRRYEEIGTGRTATVLLVHCQDARDILGHYPPACYRGQGWTLESATPMDWSRDGRVINGTRYSFTTPQRVSMTIDNFMLLPDGRTARDMNDVERVAQDQRQKHFGAGQVQLLYRSEMSDADRAEIFQTFVGMLRPVIAQITQQPGENPL